MAETEAAGQGRASGPYIAPVEFDAVRVLATDFNAALPASQMFDGWPFTSQPAWLVEAMREGLLSPNCRRHTDYADWDVRTPNGTVVTAFPGDIIARGYRGGVQVYRPAA